MVATVVVAALVSVSGPALADPSASEKETARSLVASGREKRRGGDARGALEDFQKAHDIMGVPTTGLELGRTQVALGQLVEARTTLLEIVRLPAKADEPAAFKRARHDAKKLAEALLPRLATLTVIVSGVPAGESAKISLDGVEIADASHATPLKVNPGAHDVVAVLGDHEKRVRVRLDEGKSEEIRVAFSGTAAVPDAPPPEAPPPEAPKTKTNPLVYVGIVTAGVGLAVGTTTGLLAYGAYGDLEGKCRANQCPPETHADIDRGRTFGTISTISFIVAGVGAAVFAYGFLSPVRGGESRTGVVVGPGGLSGAF